MDNVFRKGGLGSAAAQARAIESLKNIAEVPGIPMTNWTKQKIEGDQELGDLIGALKKFGNVQPSISQLADTLKWDSDKAAQALERGGQAGILGFTSGPSGTHVTLKI